MGSQSPTSKTLSHFSLLGLRYEHEVGPKTKTKTYEFTGLNLVLTLTPLEVSKTDSLTE